MIKKQNIIVIVNNEHLAATLGVAAGATVAVEVKNGVPVNREWRNRFNDATIDGCITIVKPQPKPKAPKLTDKEG